MEQATVVTLGPGWPSHPSQLHLDEALQGSTGEVVRYNTENQTCKVLLYTPINGVESVWARQAAVIDTTPRRNHA